MASTDNSSNAPERTSVETWLKGDETAPGTARGIVGRFAEMMEGSVREDAVLVASELVANAVEHGSGGEVHLQVHRTGVTELELSVLNRVDANSPDVPERPWRMPRTDAIRGRGLAVVDALSSWAGFTRTGSDVEVTATVVA